MKTFNMFWKQKTIPLLSFGRNFSKTLLKNSNHYKSLGLSPSASAADIKAAYYRLSKIYHPDRNNGSEASAKIFREISAAYEVLRKSESRRNYDREKLKNYESRKPNYAPRNRWNKRNRGNVGSYGKSSSFQDMRWKTKSSNAMRNAHKITDKEMEAFLAQSLRILIFSLWHSGNRTQQILPKPPVENGETLNKSKVINIKNATIISMNDVNPVLPVQTVKHSDVKNIPSEKEKWREIQFNYSNFGNYCLKLSKFRLTSLVVITSAVGYAIPPAPFDLFTFLCCTIGTGFVSSAANSINQFLEVPFDAQMSRTRNRVLVQGHAMPIHAVGFAAAAGTVGLAMLYYGTNALTTMLGAMNLVLYTMIYTPLKRISILNTWVGSIVGAIPPLMGWAACQGALDCSSLIVGGILFSWQFPHFNALSWNLRPDYSRAGYRMMAVTDPDLCRKTALRHTIGIIAMSTLAPTLDITHWTFALFSLPLNLYFAYLAFNFYKESDSKTSRKLFRFSLLHLPLLLTLMIITKKHWGFLSPINQSKQNKNIIHRTSGDCEDQIIYGNLPGTVQSL